MRFGFGNVTIGQWAVRVGVASMLLSFGVGCGGDPVGFWQSREELPNGKRNKLEVQDGGSGELRMWVQVSPQQDGVIRLEYDVKDWFVEADGAYEFSLECKSNCEISQGVNVTLDFEMDCEHDSTNVWLDCEAKSPWKDYGFLEFEVDE